MREIRFLGLEDLQDVQKVERYSPFKVSETLESPEYVLGAFLDDRLVGFCTCGDADDIFQSLVLSDLYITKRHRSNGFATELVKAVQSMASAKGKGIVLDSIAGDLMDLAYRME